ncbi:MAG: hypothetical protein J6L86_06280 [Alphaproteobacteria bacterium]|nr:hypothetical protein [Alphaproteobacteria bacterium]
MNNNIIAKIRTAMLKSELASVQIPIKPAVAAVIDEPKRILLLLFMI